MSATVRELAATEFGKLPYPGEGATGRRWSMLSALCRSDVAAGRLLEAHFDADAILHEIVGGKVGVDEFWGVWAAEPPRPRVVATRHDGQWLLRGVKPWCSGALSCTHALVTADSDDGRRLFAVDLAHPGVRSDVDGWQAEGMRTTETGAVSFEDVPGEAVGPPGAYLDRPGFWHGGIGVAACWLGGAQRVADLLYDRGSDTADDVTLMHLGAVDALLVTGRGLLSAVANEIDERPRDGDLARRRAFAVRWTAEQTATAVCDRVARALGPGPLAHDADHARAVADLQIYIRQSHADRDLITLGEIVCDARRQP